MQKPTRMITLSSMFLSMGVLFPIAFHAMGIGSVFLPMFWPIAGAAFFLTVPLAVLVGLLAPLISSLMTGMPPISPPILYVLMLELSALTVTTTIIYQKTTWGVFWPLLIGLLFSRFVLFLFVAAIAPLFALPATVFSITFTMKGLPGTIAIMLIVPILVSRIKHEPVIKSRRSNVANPQIIL